WYFTFLCLFYFLCFIIFFFFFFFFQAEDGIRDLIVTGVRRVLFRSKWCWKIIFACSATTASIRCRERPRKFSMMMCVSCYRATNCPQNNGKKSSAQLTAAEFVAPQR